MWLLLPAAAVAGVIATSAGQFGARWHYLISKPVPLLLLLLAVALAPAFPAQPWLLAVLALAWLGDVALLFPARGFLPGLLAFLLSHLAMLMALLAVGAAFSGVALLLALVIASVMTTLLRPHKPLLRIAVWCYCLVLALVVIVAVRFGWQSADWSGLVPAALLFAFSDGVLGWNKFRTPLRYGQLLILSSYFAAQCLFVAAFLR